MSKALRSLQPKEKFIEGLRITGTITGGARYAGVTRQTFYDWMKADQAFAKTFRDTKEEVIDEVEQAVIENAKKASAIDRIFYLKHNRPDVYSDAQSRNAGQTIVINFVPVLQNRREVEPGDASMTVVEAKKVGLLPQYSLHNDREGMTEGEVFEAEPKLEGEAT